MQYVPNCVQITNAEIGDVNGRYTSTGLQSFAKDKWILFRDGDYWKVSLASDKALYYFITSNKSFVSDVLVKKWTYSPVSLSSKFLPSELTIGLVPIRNQTEVDSPQAAELIETLRVDLTQAQATIRERNFHILSLEKEILSWKEKYGDVRSQLGLVMASMQPHVDGDSNSITEEDSINLVTPIPSFKYPQQVSEDKITALEQTVATLTAHITTLTELVQSQVPKQV